MTTITRLGTACSLAAIMAIAGPFFGDDSTSLQVRNGSVKFEAGTNMSAINVHGQANTVTADVTMRKTGGGIELENLKAIVDPKSLSTGMGLRDQHMRKRIFADSSDQLPLLEFSAQKATCPDLPQGQDVVCQLAGSLSMRGVSKPFTMSLKVRNDGKAFRVTGDGIVKLTGYGIEPPCQLGVCVLDDVRLRLEFLARPESGLRAQGLPGGRQ